MLMVDILDVCLDSPLSSALSPELGISKLIDSVSTKTASYMEFLAYCQKT